MADQEEGPTKASVLQSDPYFCSGAGLYVAVPYVAVPGFRKLGSYNFPSSQKPGAENGVAPSEAGHPTTAIADTSTSKLERSRRQ